MADTFISRSEPLVRSPNMVERPGSATDRQHRRETRQDRRDREEPNRKRRRIYDLLFDEIDEIDSLDPAQRVRIKQNLRAHLASRTPTPVPPPPQELDEEHIAATLIEDPAAAVPVDHDHIVHMAAPTHAHLSAQETEENAILAKQLRDCLSRHTIAARRVAVYLHLLLTLDGALRPHTIVDA
ncbi:hypothetical protein [Azospirillum canadense]|uniref:hypothetical protein n=1 Tax=Azospirillum canadense TaxID=403962 RepID=UPI002226C748|nr:hypothetical protein [Azospirillum canadense]MCW2237270.1 hypothetical protein [Azospirillum canadense]